MFTIFAAAGALADSSAEIDTEQNLSSQESLVDTDQGLFDSPSSSDYMDSDEDMLFELDLSDAVGYESPSMIENPYGMGSFGETPADGGDDYPLNEIEVEGLGFVPMEEASIAETVPETDAEETPPESKTAFETQELQNAETEQDLEIPESEEETDEIALDAEEMETEIEMPVEDLLDSSEEISIDYEDTEVVLPSQEETEAEDASIELNEIELDSDFKIDAPLEETDADTQLQPDLELNENDLEIDPSLKLEDLSFDGESDDILNQGISTDMDLGEPDLMIDDLDLELESTDEDPSSEDSKEEKQP